MSQELWTKVDRYFDSLLALHDSGLGAALDASAEAGLPPIHVSPNQGKLLAILAQAIRAQKVLEIGTLGGYSAIWLAQALPPGGKLITLEVEEKHAEVARQNLARAGLAERVEVRIGAALDTLPELAQEGRGPFDLVFIDADKPYIREYFEWALEMTRPGSLIYVDNVVRRGAVVDASTQDEKVLGTRRFNEMLAAEPRVTATWIQTVGSKGYDGFVIALVL